MFFQLAADFFQVRKALRHLLRQLADGVWRAQARHNVFALGIDQILAIEHLLAIGWVAGEGNPGRAVIASIAEHHGLHVHSRAPFGGDAVLLSVQDGALVSPRAEYRTHSAPQLLHNILRERATCTLADEGLVLGDQCLQILSAKRVIRRDADFLLQLL